LGRHAEAVRDWERAVDLDDGGQRAVPQLGRAIARAHVDGDPRPALAEAGALAKDADGPTPPGLARLCALAPPPVAGGQGPAAAAHFQEEYATRAVGLLRQAASKGFRDTLYLQQGTDLAILRNREDFRMLLGDTEATTDRHSP